MARGAALVFSFFWPILLLPKSIPTNIGFFGERASGMGGAFTAIADDASGTYYNPAGLSFTSKTFLTISSSTFQSQVNLYRGVDGIGRDYVRSSEDYLPNFLGFVSGSNRIRYGFSFVNPISRDTNRSNTQRLPLQTAGGELPYATYAASYRESIGLLQFGPSIGYRVNERLSIGITVYHTRQSYGILAVDEYQKFDGTWSREVAYDNKLALGVQPVLGILYLLTDKLFLGASLRRDFTTGGKRNSYFSNYPYFQYAALDGSSGVDADGNPFIKSPTNARLTEQVDGRMGVAYYANNRLLLSFDILYHGRYRRKADQYLITGGDAPALIYGDRDYHELRRNEVVNYASGVEYYLFPEWVLRFGVFTNQTANPKINWLGSVAEAFIYDKSSNLIQLNPEGNLFLQGIPNGNYKFDFHYTYYQDSLRSLGLTCGLSYTIGGSTIISLTYMRERGNGMSIFYFPNPAVQSTYSMDRITFAVTATGI